MWLVGGLRHRLRAALIYAWIYWRIERREGMSLLKAVGYAHLFVLYGLLPSLYGWRAVARELTGRTGWAKTAREAEPAQGKQTAPSRPAAGPNGSASAGSPLPSKQRPPSAPARAEPLTAPRAAGPGSAVPAVPARPLLNPTAMIVRRPRRTSSNLTNEEMR